MALNRREDILAASSELLLQIVEANGIKPDQIASILFTTTPDLNAEFPAAAAREMGWHTVPLICAREVDVPGALPMCLRILVLCNTDREPDQMVHIYTRGAAELRSKGAVQTNEEAGGQYGSCSP